MNQLSKGEKISSIPPLQVSDDTVKVCFIDRENTSAVYQPFVWTGSCTRRTSLLLLSYSLSHWMLISIKLYNNFRSKLQVSLMFWIHWILLMVLCLCISGKLFSCVDVPAHAMHTHTHMQACRSAYVHTVACAHMHTHTHMHRHLIPQLVTGCFLIMVFLMISQLHLTWVLVKNHYYFC